MPTVKKTINDTWTEIVSTTDKDFLAQVRGKVPVLVTYQASLPAETTAASEAAVEMGPGDWIVRNGLALGDKVFAKKWATGESWVAVTEEV